MLVAVIPDGTYDAFVVDAEPGLADDGTEHMHLDLTILSGEQKGNMVSLTAAGDLVFTPAANYNGPASFDYTISDGTATSTAHVTVNVAAVGIVKVPPFTEYSLDTSPLTAMGAAALIPLAMAWVGDNLFSYAQAMVAEGLRVVTAGWRAGAEGLKIVEIQPRPNGQTLTLRWRAGSVFASAQGASPAK